MDKAGSSFLETSLRPDRGNGRDDEALCSDAGPIDRDAREPALHAARRTRPEAVVSRRTTLTPEAHERFVQALGIGAFPEVAARFAGFSAASYYRYMQALTPEHAAFRQATLDALAAVELRWTGILAKAALEDPRWAYILLKARFSQRWLAPAGETDPADDPGPSPKSDPADVDLLDPALVETLVPRLLAKGRQTRGAVDTPDDHVDRFIRRASRRVRRGERV
jgi:hypothetical protein